MVAYDFFCIDDSGRIGARERHECRTNAEAHDTARAISNGRDIEIWRGKTCIALRERQRFSAVAKHIQLWTPPATD